MHTPKRYIHDRLVLLLLTANTFFAVLTSVMIILKLDGSRAEGYIVQFRPSLGLSAYYKGNSVGMISFVVFVLFVLVFHTYMSIRTYGIRRHFAIMFLGTALVLILLAMVISNALLLLR